MGQVKVDQIVAEQEVRAIGQVVQLGQCRGQAVGRPGEDQGLTGTRASSSESMDAAVPDADFKVQ